MKSLDGSGKSSKNSTEEEAQPAIGFFTPNDKIDFSKVEIEPLFADSVDFETFSKEYLD